MVSKTKCKLDEKTIQKMFESAGISPVSEIYELGAGEFNAVYQVKADKDYVLKIAPSQSTPVLTYEKDMIKAEVYWYDQIRENTSIKVPDVYYTDFSGKIIPNDWFIMEKLDGRQKNEVKLDPEPVKQKTAQMLAAIHKIKNDKYGYIQNGLYDNWYDALTSIIKNLLYDAQRVGRKSKNGAKLLKYAEKYKSVLQNVPCCMVNYDLWDPNVICKKNGDDVEFQWIDPERSFWGDRVFDFLCLENPAASIKNKMKSVEYYNQVADEPLIINKEVEIRFAFALGLLALIQEVEKYYRYTPHHFGWWRNVGGHIFYYKMAFGVLKNG